MRVGTRVYVGKLSYDVRERDLEKFFKGYGRVREILMKEGFAFVEFDDHRDADDAVYDLNGKDLMGERVHVEFAREQRGPRRFGGSGGGRYGGGRYESSRSRGGGFRSGGLHYAEKYGPPRNTEFRVIVENLSSRVSWQDLKDFMRSAGEVTYADAHKRERNMGIVDFNSYNDMKSAIDKLDGSDLHGRKIRLVEDKTRRTRGGSRRRSRSRSRSRQNRSYSRSRSRSRSKGSDRNGDRKSRSRSRSRSRSKSRSVDRKSRSRSRSYDRKSRSYDRSRSRSVNRKSKSRSKSPADRKSRSRSKSPADRKVSRSNGSRSRSVTPRSKDADMNGDE